MNLNVYANARAKLPLLVRLDPTKEKKDLNL